MAAKETGRPGYGPADLLKLYVSGYINRAIQPAAEGGGPSQHRSDLAAAAQRHLRTIGDLRRVNGRPSNRYSASWYILCRQPDYSSRASCGRFTCINAVNNKDRNFRRGSLTRFINEADEKLAGYMKRLDEGGAQRRKPVATAAAPVAAMATCGEDGRYQRQARPTDICDRRFSYQ
ncbi:hypothetical protein [Rhizobium sp. HT1-10]|uniref:hypothetical protein n=1 Tax=Rhizobium sp. HT1-10 TaxID=3111638 RepID=UPI003C181B9E